MPAPSSNFSRYVIPSDLTPEGICCICVPVPNDREYIAQFMGALWRMSLQTNYERDPAQSGKVVAAIWRGIWAEVQAVPGCCGGEATTINTVNNNNVNIQQYLYQLRLTYIAASLDIDVAFPNVPDDFDTDPGDVGPQIAQRNRALCLTVESWVNELMNRGLEHIEKAIIGAVGGVTGGIIVPFIPVWVVTGGFVAVAILLAELASQLRDTEYRTYLKCGMFEALKGVDTNSPTDFADSWDSLPTRPPPPQFPSQDIARDAIEAWGRSQLNNLDNYLGFIDSLQIAMGAAESLVDSDCVCISGWQHDFLGGFGLGDLSINAWPDSPFPLATYNSGDDEIVGDCVTDAGLFTIVELIFTASNITRVVMVVGVKEAGGGSPTDHLRIWDGVMNVGALLVDVAVAGESDVTVDTGTISISTGELNFEAVVGTGSGDCSGGRNDIISVTVFGTGANPFL